MNGNKTLPARTWKDEYAKLTAEQKMLNGRYLALKDEVKKAEKIRKSVYDILRRDELLSSYRMNEAEKITKTRRKLTEEDNNILDKKCRLYFEKCKKAHF